MFAKTVPPGKSHTTFRNQHTRKFRENALWSGEVADTKAAHNSVKRGRNEWQLLSAAFPKVEMRMQSMRQRNHCWCDIDADHARTTLCGLCCERSGASCDVEQAGPVSDVSRLEQWLDCSIRHCRKSIVIALGKFVVNSLFEIPECFQVNLGQAHVTPLGLASRLTRAGRGHGVAVAVVTRSDEPVRMRTPSTMAIRNSAGTSPRRCPRSAWSLNACQAMIAPWTTLDHTVNQIRLLCASGSCDAIRRNTPSVA